MSTIFELKQKNMQLKIDLATLNRDRVNLSEHPISKQIKGKTLFFLSVPGADLRGVDFTGAELNWAYFHRANLKDADFTNANLEHASLDEGANLQGVNFTNANITLVQFFSEDIEMDKPVEELGERFEGIKGLTLKQIETLGPSHKAKLKQVLIPICINY